MSVHSIGVITDIHDLEAEVSRLGPDSFIQLYRKHCIPGEASHFHELL